MKKERKKFGVIDTVVERREKWIDRGEKERRGRME